MKNIGGSSFKLALLVVMTSLIASSRPTFAGNASVPEYLLSNQALTFDGVSRESQAPTPYPSHKPVSRLAPQSAQTISTTDSAVTLLEESIRFAVIGDFGDDSAEEGYVADLVDSWSPDFVVTVGDNNYMDISSIGGTIDENIGQYYQQYIYPYPGDYGDGSLTLTNRFFPALGNHDLVDDGAAHFTFFTLPGNERYYDFVQGPVHFFIVNSDSSEPDGRTSTSAQGQWLQSGLAASTAPWQVVIFHDAAYSSGRHGSTTVMRWPFKDWGVDAVLSGHDHSYERLSVAGLPYFVNGMGGKTHYEFRAILLPESLVQYNDLAGAMLVEASPAQMFFKFFTYTGVEIDSLTLGEPPTPVEYINYIPIIFAP